MKTIYSLLIILLFYSYLPAQNLIPNGGFDEGPDWSCCMIFPAPMDSACNVIDSVYLAGPDYWYSYGDASIRFVYENPIIECYDNTIPPTMPSWIFINQYEKVGVSLTIPLISGHKYRLSYYVKIDSVSTVLFPIYGQMDTWAYFIFNNSGNIIQSPTFNIQNNLNIWQQYDTTFFAESNSDVIEIWGNDSIFTVLLFDNFELTEISTSIEETDFNSYNQPNIYTIKKEIIVETFHSEQYCISVFDILGKCVYSETIKEKGINKIHTNNLNNGVYLINIQSNNLFFSKKVLIN
ncbi:MAG: T9SS type A sorting domain-containing protein [Bacteroidota bacterium]